MKTIGYLVIFIGLCVLPQWWLMNKEDSTQLGGKKP